MKDLDHESGVDYLDHDVCAVMSLHLRSVSRRLRSVSTVCNEPWTKHGLCVDGADYSSCVSGIRSPFPPKGIDCILLVFICNITILHILLSRQKELAVSHAISRGTCLHLRSGCNSRPSALPKGIGCIPRLSRDSCVHLRRCYTTRSHVPSEGIGCIPRHIT